MSTCWRGLLFAGKQPRDLIARKRGQRAERAISQPQGTALGDRYHIADQGRRDPRAAEPAKRGVGSVLFGSDQQAARCNEPQRIESKVPAQAFALGEQRELLLLDHEPDAGGLGQFPEARRHSPFGRIMQGVDASRGHGKVRIAEDADPRFVQEIGTVEQFIVRKNVWQLLFLFSDISAVPSMAMLLVRMSTSPGFAPEEVR